MAGTVLLPVFNAFASFPMLLELLCSLWRLGARTSRGWLGTLFVRRFGPRKGCEGSFIIFLLFVLSPLLIAILILLFSEGSLLVSFSQLLLYIGGDGQVASKELEQGWAAHDLPFITGNTTEDSALVEERSRACEVPA